MPGIRALNATVETDINGYYTIQVKDISYDASTQCFVFSHKGKITYMPREVVKVITEGK